MRIRVCLAIVIGFVAADALYFNHFTRNDGDGMNVAGSAKKMPLIGFGTCCRASANGAALIQSTLSYLRNGGRLIDTAQMYGNHNALKEAIQGSGVAREELWVTSKLNTKGHVSTEQKAVDNVDWSLHELGLDYLDLMLIHGAWENSLEAQESIWKGLIKAKETGKVKNIGVSNFNKEQIENLVAKTNVMPAVLQIEYHPWVLEETHDLVRWCQQKGIAVTAYGSLGGSRNKASSDAVAKVAEKHRSSNAQVLLKWALKRGCAVIPGATSEDHIKECLASKDLELAEDDIASIESSSAPGSWKRWHNCKSGCAK